MPYLAKGLTKLDLIEYEGSGSLTEIYSTGFQFAMLNKNKFITPWFLCKDYFNDLVWATIKKQNSGIYGYQTDNTKYTFSFKNAYLAVRNKQETDKDKFLKEVRNSVSLINNFFKGCGVKNKKFAIIGANKANKECEIIISIPSFFFVAPTLISIFTLLMRCGSFYMSRQKPMTYFKSILEDKIKLSSKNDKNYLNSSMAALVFLEETNFNKFFSKSKENWNKLSDIHMVHNGTGIVAFSNFIVSLKELKPQNYSDFINKITGKK